MNYKNEISLKKSTQNKSNNLKLKSRPYTAKEKLSLFLRNQDYFLYNLLNKKMAQEKQYPQNRKFNFDENNQNGLPSIKIKKIIKIGKNGFYSFKKIDYNYNPNNKLKKKIRIKEKETDDNNSYSNYNIIQNHKKSLIKNNSVKLLHKKNGIFDKIPQTIRINNPLVITHINKVKINSNKFKLKRNFSSKSVQKEESKAFHNDIIDKKNLQHNIFIYKKSEGTQINEDHGANRDNIFFSEKKTNKIKINYCSPKSIIFHKKKICYDSYNINED